MIQRIEDIHGAAVTVAGLGQHGGAAGNIRWLADQGARLIVTDLKTTDELAESVEALRDIPDITWRLGEHREEDFTQADFVLRNPAVPSTSPYLEAARAAGVSIEMDSSLLLKLAPTRDIIGVTGSKGKTTTTRAISHVLAAGERGVHVVGIEGTSPLAILPDVSADDIIVFELSSWRLEALAEHGLSPATAVVTSLYRDHLNTYPNWEAYEAAKQAIVRAQGASDTALLNWDDERVRRWSEWAPSQVVWYGLGEPATGDGIFLGGSRLSLRQDEAQQELAVKLPERLLGAHQRRNVLPAVWLALSRGVDPVTISERLATLPTVPHRLEVVATIDGVTYVNDSAATIPDATRAALETYRDQHVVLICGGNDKDLVFDELARHIAAASLRAVVLLTGTITPTIKALVEKAGAEMPLIDADSMAEAVAAAHNQAQPGDTVLLSPGATSFALFQHEFERGEAFRAEVRKLAE